MESTFSVFEKKHGAGVLTLGAIFSPEHGLFGVDPKAEVSKTDKGIIVYSLYDAGVPRRISKEMAKGIDVLVYDIQDIGSRSYTYVSALYYVMEDAAKLSIPVVVLDRPNPLGGLLVDGPMLQKEYRSYVGYANVPYCHGMTVGELARFFRGEYGVSCQLTVVPMQGWNRSMRFDDTKLSWVPTSPNIPEPSSALFYPATGLLGELAVVFIGVGSPLPFRVIAAPWISGKELTAALQRPGPEGVCFQEIHIVPTMGQYRDKPCEGTLLIIKNPERFNPIKVFYWVVSTLKELYPTKLREAIAAIPQEALFYKACGSKKIAEILLKEDLSFPQLVCLDEKERQEFLAVRKKYLIPSYENSSHTPPPSGYVSKK
jgi:uncharacterized protein YbbC (DUF1343 family)